MKRMFCILTATMILAVFMTGCGCSDQGKIGNGNNGTYSDNNNKSTENATANNKDSTENNTDNTTNNTDTTNGNTNNGNTNNNNNNAGNDTTGNVLGNDNNNSTESYTEDSSQEGLAGRVGDAIDEGLYGIEEGLTGNDDNTQSTEY